MDLSFTLQILKPTKFKPFLSLARQVGVYPCDIKVNLHGAPELSLLRDTLACFDNNAFVTLLVSSILLEAAKFWKGPLPSDNQLYIALEAISEYHDRNYCSNDGIVTFWRQIYNATTGEWTSWPENAGNIAWYNELILEEVQKLLDEVGLLSLSGKITPLVGFL